MRARVGRAFGVRSLSYSYRVPARREHAGARPDDSLAFAGCINSCNRCQDLTFVPAISGSRHVRTSEFEMPDDYVSISVNSKISEALLANII